MQLTGLTNTIAAILSALAAVGLWAFAWHSRRRRKGQTGVQNWQLLLVGIGGTWLFLSLTLGAAAWAVYSNQGLATNPAQDADAGPLRWYFNLVLEGGPPAGRPVYSLTFIGTNRSQKEVLLKSANIVSARNGKKIDLDVIARDDNGENIVPIDQINLIPPGAPIKLVAKFGDSDPNAAGKVLGLEAKDFLETWSQFYLNVEDNSQAYRLPFNEGNLTAFFPGMVGPRITKK